MDYTTLDRVKNYLLQDVEEWYEPTIEGWITTMSRLMDQLCNRTLVAEEGSDTTRYFDGNGKARIIIDDVHTISQVEVGDEYGENLEEVMDTIPYPKIPPHNILFSKSGFPSGLQNVAITGKFGLFETLPEDIAFACTVLTAGVSLNQIKPKQEITSERIGNYSVSFSTDEQKRDFARAMEIINSYRRVEI